MSVVYPIDANVCATAIVLWIVVESYVTTERIMSQASRKPRVTSESEVGVSITTASYRRRSNEMVFSTSRTVIISAISTRGGARRMSMPAGPRHMTLRTSDSCTRSVGRSRIDKTSSGTLSRTRRSPYWRLPSIRAVETPS